MKRIKWFIASTFLLILVFTITGYCQDINIYTEEFPPESGPNQTKMILRFILGPDLTILF